MAHERFSIGFLLDKSKLHKEEDLGPASTI